MVGNVIKKVMVQEQKEENENSEYTVKYWIPLKRSGDLRNGGDVEVQMVGGFNLCVAPSSVHLTRFRRCRCTGGKTSRTQAETWYDF